MRHRPARIAGDRPTAETTVAGLALLLAVTLTAAAFAAPRIIEIRATDDLRYSVSRIDARPGEELRVVLIAIGSQTKEAMAHNFVLLDAATDVETFVMMSSISKATAYVAPSLKNRIRASTPLVGGGERATVTFKAPTKPGSYPYVCTFPGHYAGGMKGVLVVR